MACEFGAIKHGRDHGRPFVEDPTRLDRSLRWRDETAFTAGTASGPTEFVTETSASAVTTYVHRFGDTPRCVPR